MRIIIGYGNSLRGEDAFGVDAITLLQKQKLVNTKLISVYQLTPELCLDILEATQIVFIDATFSNENHYAIACNIIKQKNVNLSHHISFDIIISLLNNVYGKFPKFEVYSMLTNSFDKIDNKNKYEDCLDNLVSYLVS